MDSETRVILITGSSGFIGQALSQHFGNQPNTLVVGFDRFESKHPTPKEECLFCDMSSDESVQKTFQLLSQRNGNKIAHVFHLAAYYSFSGEDSPMYKKVTVEGTERLLRELQNFEVGQFVFSSSMLVHKPNKPGEKITEDSPIEATWQYPKSKVETEKVVSEKHGKIPTVILRIAGVYGDNCNSIPVAHQIQRIYEGQLEGHLYSGDTDVRQSFMHVDDLVDAFQAVVDRKDVLPNLSVFEIGEPDAMSYEEMQKEMGMLIHGTDWKTFSVPKPIAKLGAMVEMEIPFVEKPFVKPWMVDHADDNYDISIDKAKAVLGWSPKRHMVDVIPKMIANLKADPVAFYKTNDLKEPSWLKDKEPERVTTKAAEA